MKKVNGFISIEVVLIASLMILIVSSLNKMVYNNKILINNEHKILENELKNYDEENEFLKKAINEINQIEKLDKDNLKGFSYADSNKKIIFSYDSNEFIVEEKIENYSIKKNCYYDYFIECNKIKLKKRRFYEFK